MYNCYIDVVLDLYRAKEMQDRGSEARLREVVCVDNPVTLLVVAWNL
jgi:hypothetical protein